MAGNFKKWRENFKNGGKTLKNGGKTLKTDDLIKLEKFSI
jgi:hypothetical protein